MVVKYNSIFHSTALQIFTKIGIFGLKISHPATLLTRFDGFYLFTAWCSQQGVCFRRNETEKKKLFRGRFYEPPFRPQFTNAKADSIELEKHNTILPG
jgi:hypothetical protein